MWKRLQSQLEPLDIAGPIEVKLDLDLPLGLPAEHQTLMGIINFEGGSVGMPSLNLNFTDLKGRMTFNKQGVYADNIVGNFYGKPVNAQLATQLPTGAPSFLKMAMQGQIDMTHLQQRYPNPLWADWQGSAPFAAQVEWRQPHDKLPSQLKVTSNLQGLAINLPAPFAKNSAQTQALSLVAEFGNTQKRTQLSYGKILQADMYYTSTQNKTTFTKGRIEFPVTSATPMKLPAQGIDIVGNLPALDVDAWLARTQGMFKGGNSSVTIPSVNGKLKVNSVKIMDKQLAVQTLNFQHGAQQWKINLYGKDAQGQIIIPDQLRQRPINVSLDYLNWKTSGDNQSNKDNTPPDNFPNFNVMIKKTSINDKNYGALKFSTKTGKKSLAINSLSLTDTDYHFTATSFWDWSKSPSATSLKGIITSQNLGGMLSQLGITSGMQGGKGTSKLNLSWQGGPAAWSLDNLKGEIVLNWTNGRLVDVKPGLGRILSLFSVQSITRRLRLDFSDVFKKGFTFDKIMADVLFNQGTINTKTGEVSSTAGKLNLTGTRIPILKL